MMTRTQKIALSGISGALTVIFLLGAVFLPVANVAFWVAAALCLLIPLAGSDSGVIFSVLVYAGASAIALMPTGDYFQVLPFICFFGPYAIIWFFLKKVNLSIYLRYIIQYIFLFFAVWICYSLIKSLAFEHVAAIDTFVREKWWLALIILAAGVPVYNFALKEGWRLIGVAYKNYKKTK